VRRSGGCDDLFGGEQGGRGAAEQAVRTSSGQGGGGDEGRYLPLSIPISGGWGRRGMGRWWAVQPAVEAPLAGAVDFDSN